MADFQQHAAELNALDVRVVAVSSDARDDAVRTADTLGLGVTVLCELDAADASRSIGCYTGLHKDIPHVQPASFVLAPDGTVVYAVYSSGQVGRFTAADALVIARGLWKAKSAATTG